MQLKIPNNVFEFGLHAFINRRIALSMGKANFRIRMEIGLSY
jgi:hypothetical protein